MKEDAMTAAGAFGDGDHDLNGKLVVKRKDDGWR